MDICSLPFLVFCGLIVILFHFFRGKRARKVFLSLVNALFLVPLVPNWQSGIWLLTLLGGTFCVLKLVRMWPRGWLVWAGILFVFVMFICLKNYPFVPMIVPVEFLGTLWYTPLFVVGLSYMVFKFVHLLVDQWQGQLDSFTLTSYLNYQLSFFTLTAGPIQRYNDFHRGWEEMDLRPTDARETLLSWSRLLTGMLKMVVLAGLAGYAFERAGLNLRSVHSHYLQAFFVYFYAFPIYLYFNFSGYTDVVIGSAGLLGFALPENFNRPYLARNVLDFWNRWHMTLTHWIRDYIFMASYKEAATRLPRAARYLSYPCLFLAMLFAGAWHGTTMAFVVFGALNGLGAVVAQAYGDLLKATLGRAGWQRYHRNAAIRCAAIVLTFHYVCFCLLFFSSGLADAIDILRRAGEHLGDLPLTVAHSRWEAGTVAAVVLPCTVLAALWKADTVRSFAARIPAPTTSSVGSLYRLVAGEAVLVVLILCFRWAYEQEPPQVLYMRF